MTDSSDERSEYWNVSMRGNRKAQARRGRLCPSLFRACNAFFGCASVLATASLIWLFIDVRQQLTSLRVEVDQGTDNVKTPNIILQIFLQQNVYLISLNIIIPH